MVHKAQTTDFAKTSKQQPKRPSNRYIDIQDNRNFEEAKRNRKEFMMKHGSTNQKNSLLGSLENIPETGHIQSAHANADPNNQNMSYDTYDLYEDEGGSVSQKNPIGNSMISQDDEKLESLLERLEESRLPDKGFTMQERNMIMEDTQYLAMLSGSETLYRIFQLMYNAQEKVKNHEDLHQLVGVSQAPGDKSDMKMTFDLEFEKLLIMLKEQYHSLFEK